MFLKTRPHVVQEIGGESSGVSVSSMACRAIDTSLTLSRYVSCNALSLPLCLQRKASVLRISSGKGGLARVYLEGPCWTHVCVL